MDRKLSKILEKCLTRMSDSSTIEECLSEYADMRSDLEPLLYTALYVSSIPKASASEVFRRASTERLVTRLCEQSSTAAAPQPAGRSLASCLRGQHEQSAVISRPRKGWMYPVSGARRAAIPVALSLVLVIVGVLLLAGAPVISPQSIYLASQCTLTIVDGGVTIQRPGASDLKHGTDGMTLPAGTVITTDVDSRAVLTFFEGSTIELEPGTSIEVMQAGQTDGQSTGVILRQWAGRTWSRVTKMTDSGSHYEIVTPSASAVVRGTLFMTEVDEAGATTVRTLEGLVSVIAQDQEVEVAAGYQTVVAVGETPGEPTWIRPPGGGSGGWLLPHGLVLKR